MSYDERTVVWYSPFTMWHPNFGAKTLYIWIALIGLFLMPQIADGLSFASEVVVIALAIVILIAARMHSIILAAKGKLPFVAIAPDGLIVNRTGLPGRVVVLGWENVRTRMDSTGGGWSCAKKMLSDLGVVLPELFVAQDVQAAMQKRLGETKSAGGN